MAEYIERDAILDYLQIIPIDLGYREIDDVTEFVKKQPAADVVPVRHGRWTYLVSLNGDEFDKWKCSECGHYTRNGADRNYCIAAVFIPSTKVLLEMMVAKLATKNNIDLTVDSLKSVVDYIAETIKSLR